MDQSLYTILKMTVDATFLPRRVIATPTVNNIRAAPMGGINTGSAIPILEA